MVNPDPSVRVRRARPGKQDDYRYLALATYSVAIIAFLGTRVWIATNAVMPKGPDIIGPWAVAFWASGSDPAIDMGTSPPYSVFTRLLPGGTGCLVSAGQRCPDGVDGVVRWHVELLAGRDILVRRS